MSYTKRNILLVLLAFSFSALGACKEEKVEKPKQKPVLSPKPRQRPMRAKQRVSQKKDMKEIAKVVEEMRRRAEGKISMDAPARRVQALLDKLPVKHYPATYHSFLDDLKDRLKILQKSTRYKKDYNGMIEACLACHKIYAPQVVFPMEKLKLP